MDQDDSDKTSQEGSQISKTDRHGFIGGSQYMAEPPPPLSPSVILNREKKWLRMLDRWNWTMQRDYARVRSRCRKGIPASLRPRAWLYLCGAYRLLEKNGGSYSAFVDSPGDPKWVDDIMKDLHRQFPHHEMFAEEQGIGQRQLFQVLKAYSILSPRVGYCQAQAPVAAFLLMHLPAEHAFWVLVAVCDKYLPGYYDQGMETLQLDGDILFGLTKRWAPKVYHHLKKQKVDPLLYMTEWFLCVFTRTLPWDTLLRVWDMFLCEGVKVLFKVALIMMKASLGSASTLRQCPSLYETLEALRKPPLEALQPDKIVQQMARLNLSEEDLKNEHRRQTLKRRKNHKR